MSAMFDRGYALLIGVGESAYSKWSLPVTVKDTQAIYAALIDPELCGYPREQIRILNNAEATHVGVLDGLKWLKEKAEADCEATAIVYYSGHGWVDNEGKYYLIQHDVNPLKIATSALSADVFTKALGEIQVDRLLIIIDSCHAAGMATSKEADDELMDDLEGFDRVAFSKGLIESLKQGKGRVVFTSSEGHQKSWIDKERSLSVFTLHLLEALQGAGNKIGDTEVRVSNLMNYLGKAVPETVRRIFNREQTPHFDFDTGDFVIAKLRGGKGLPDKGWEGLESADKKYSTINQNLENKFSNTTINIENSNGVDIGNNKVNS